MLRADMDQGTYEDILQSEECTTSDSAAFYAAACSRPGARVRLVLDGAISPLLIGGNQKSEIENQISGLQKKLEDTSGYRMSY